MDSGSGRVEIALVGAQRPEVLAELERRFLCHRVYEAPDPLGMLREIGPRVRGAASHGMAGLPTKHIELMPKLEICAINGVGLETTDVALAKQRKIVITTTPVLYDDVADLAIALALGACRQIARGDRFIRAGKWGPERLQLGRKLTGMRAGIIGLGRIGQEVATRLQAFKADIRYCDPIDRQMPYRRFTDPIAMAGDSDILFLAAAGGPRGANPPIVNRAIIDALGPRGIFVNVARGWLVDEPALIAALKDGRLGAAALDVFDDEPNVPEALRMMDNVVMTPHVASSTEETMRAMGENVIGNLVSWFEGRGALTPLA